LVDNHVGEIKDSADSLYNNEVDALLPIRLPLMVAVGDPSDHQPLLLLLLCYYADVVFLYKFKL
jgi:hypothetical protein